MLHLYYANSVFLLGRESFFTYDIIIIGSGIVGLNAAIHLKKTTPTLKIAILEKGFLPTGTSTKNAGFACFGSISELIEQEECAGLNGLAMLIEKRWKGLLKLRNLLGDKTVDYQCLGGYELFKNVDIFWPTHVYPKLNIITVSLTMLLALMLLPLLIRKLAPLVLEVSELYCKPIRSAD